MAESAYVEILFSGAFEQEVECADDFVVDCYRAVVQVPFVRPKQVAPTGIGSFYDKGDVVDIAVVVVVNVDVCW